ncbi:MAG: SDR family oxidoreductase [Solirubrobacterales bacterium]|nr:SDR family oxidoreductase [Solirubrobacterales bacterium]
MPELGTVLITGGASGLGEAVAHMIAAQGGVPVVLDRNEPADGFEWDRVDLAHPRQAEAAVHRVAERHGGLNGAVTAAGIDACGRIEDVDPDSWDRVVAVNLLGTAAVARAALPYLERSRGRIITVASTLGLRALSDATAYCASKFGVVGFSRALAVETAGRVGVTCLIPGGMQTAFFDGRDAKYKPPADAQLARPEQVAEAVLFALTRPNGTEVRELLVCPATESSWP